MLTIIRKRKPLLLFLVSILTASSILFNGFIVSDPVLADDNLQGALNRDILNFIEETTSDDPEETTTEDPEETITEDPEDPDDPEDPEETTTEDPEDPEETTTEDPEDPEETTTEDPEETTTEDPDDDDDDDPITTTSHDDDDEDDDDPITTTSHDDDDEDDDDPITTTSHDDDDEDDDHDDDDDPITTTTSHDDDDEDDDHDDDHDGLDDDDEDKLSREVKVEYEDDKVKIESKLKSDDRKDEFKVELKGEDDLRIKYEYESEAGDLESEIELKVRFTDIIEWNDTGEDGFNEEDILQRIPLKDFTFTLDTVVTGDNILYETNATYTFDNDGYFRVRVFASENFTLIDGQQIAPTTLKFDIEIFQFPYIDTTGSSQLALDSRAEVESSAAIEYIENDNGTLMGMNATIGNYTAEFTWVGDVALGNDMIGKVDAFIYDTELKTESGKEEVELKMYLLYPRGEHIIHDPQIGTPLKALTYAQDIQVAIPKPVLPESLKNIIPQISIGSLLIGSLVATLIVITIPVLSQKRKQ